MAGFTTFLHYLRVGIYIFRISHSRKNKSEREWKARKENFWE